MFNFFSSQQEIELLDKRECNVYSIGIHFFITVQLKSMISFNYKIVCVCFNF